MGKGTLGPLKIDNDPCLKPWGKLAFDLYFPYVDLACFKNVSEIRDTDADIHSPIGALDKYMHMYT